MINFSKTATKQISKAVLLSFLIQAIESCSIGFAGQLDLALSNLPEPQAPVTATAPASAEQTHGNYSYSKPTSFSFFTHVPGDYIDLGRLLFRRQSLPVLALVAASSAMLIANDEAITRRTKGQGNRWNLKHTSQQNPVFKFSLPGQKKLVSFRGPNDLSGGLYYLGDGFLHLTLAGGFLTTGLIAHDNRALQTSSQIAEGLVTSGIAVQVLKRSTGRQDPNASTRSGGKWTLLPSFATYQKNVAGFDAFPSGHLTSAMATATVIAENYPEYKFIWPLSGLLMSALGFQMINNNVHWAGDYPLALAMGWSFGHIAAQRGRSIRDGSGEKSMGFEPMLVERGAGLKFYVRLPNGTSDHK